VAELLWIIAVTKVPIPIPNNRLLVKLQSISFSRFPATFCNPLPLKRNPKRKMAKPPERPKKRYNPQNLGRARMEKNNSSLTKG